MDCQSHCRSPYPVEQVLSYPNLLRNRRRNSFGDGYRRRYNVEVTQESGQANFLLTKSASRSNSYSNYLAWIRLVYVHLKNLMFEIILWCYKSLGGWFRHFNGNFMMPSPIILMPFLQENVIQKIWECCCKDGKVLFERETRPPLDQCILKNWSEHWLLRYKVKICNT